MTKIRLRFKLLKLLWKSMLKNNLSELLLRRTNKRSLNIACIKKSISKTNWSSLRRLILQIPKRYHLHKKISLQWYKPFLTNTRCKITKEMFTFLFKLLGDKTVTLTLLYSGHLNGWTCKDFLDRCDSKGRTVSLFQIRPRGLYWWLHQSTLGVSGAWQVEGRQ